LTLLPGTSLGPYEILSALGVGGMGEVYKARDTRLDRTVELKILPESLAADPQFRERFDREVIRVARGGFEPPYPRFKINYRGGRRLWV
jgi:hypothetical protein